MKNAFTCPSLVLLVLLDARASHPQQQPVDSTTATAVAIDANTDSGWQTLRADYMAYVQRQAGGGVSGATQTKSVVTSALDACEDAPCTMHDGLCDRLSTSMSSSGAHKTADRVTKDTRKKAHIYLMSYVDHAHYLTRSR